MTGFWIFLTVVFLSLFFFTRQTRYVFGCLAPVAKAIWPILGDLWDQGWFRAIPCLLICAAFGWFGAWGVVKFKGTWAEDPIGLTAFFGVIIGVIGIIANVKGYFE